MDEVQEFLERQLNRGFEPFPPLPVIPMICAGPWSHHVEVDVEEFKYLIPPDSRPSIPGKIVLDFDIKKIEDELKET